ncbi:hypothetical protein [Bradyrhizobium ivorense]|uniref:hypothetical protein n=1 Tax=Bradyrhizobium ivorense TaxID=2511166 RepID=UPI0027E25FF9|nr:hypothetical protein [Bradyrhizobium ivorense]
MHGGGSSCSCSCHPVDAIATACIEINGLAGGAVLSATGESTHRTNADGDLQKDLDFKADQIIRDALSRVPIAALASKEGAKPHFYDSKGKVSIAVDLLDGSSNVEINMTVGTICSIAPFPKEESAVFRHGGSEQIVAGFVVCGLQTLLVLTLGDGVDIFTLDRANGVFKLSRPKAAITTVAADFVINSSKSAALGFVCTGVRGGMSRRRRRFTEQGL